MFLKPLPSPILPPAAPPAPVETDALDAAGDILLEQAASVTDPHLQQLLFRAGCALVDFQLQPAAPANGKREGSADDCNSRPHTR